jgi:hypothetical protein
VTGRIIVRAPWFGGAAMRRCGRCGELKPVEDFAWRRKQKGQRHNYCRPCHAEYHREHYLANKERYVQQAHARKEALYLERTKYLIEFFSDHPCVDCGERDPVVLEFDHLGDKEFDIGHALPYRGWQSILDEIAKCDVVCRNCHRRRESRRMGALRFRLTDRESGPTR